MKPIDSGGDEERLTALFQAYREACPAPQAGVDFMPKLWQKIEARQTGTLIFGRLSRALVTVAMAMSIVMGAYLAIPSVSTEGFYGGTYLDVLADDDAADHLGYDEPLQAELNIDPVSLEE